MTKHFSLAVAVLLAASALAQAGVVNIVKTVNPGTSDAALDLTGTVTNDIKLNSPGTTILSQQLRLVLTTGTVKDSAFGSNTPPTEALLGTFPNLAWDSFVAAGGPTSSSPSPTLVGRSDELGGPGGVPALFSAMEYDALWGPSLGQDTADKTDFLSARLTLSGNATGTFSYRAVFGDNTQLMQNIQVQNGVICVPGACGGPTTVVGDLNLVADTLNETVTGIVALTDVATLAFDAINAPVFTPLIPGKTLELPNLPTLDNAGNFSWNTAGAKRGTYAWAITGTGGGTDGGIISVEVQQVPEPATFAMVGLALVGCVGVARRRS